MIKKLGSQIWAICQQKYNLKIQGTRSLSTNSKMSSDIVWMDMEMTGLDIENDQILEIACVITNKDLQIISSKFHEYIHQSESVLDNMNDWCKKNHAESGLVKAVQQSCLTVQQVEEKLLEFVKTYVKQERTVPLAGNSIWMDRCFLRKHMPKVDDYLHYRIIDVSTLKELCHRWNRSVYDGIQKKKINHRALDDVQESIDELDYYRKTFCVKL